DHLLPGPCDPLPYVLSDVLPQSGEKPPGGYVPGWKARPDVQDARQHDGTQQTPPMVIHPVTQARVAREIYARHVLQAERLPIRPDEARPDDQPAVLAIDDGAIVGAYQLAPLRDEQVATADGVVDVFADLRQQLPREIAVDAGEQHGRDQPAGLDLIGGP